MSFPQLVELSDRWLELRSGQRVYTTLEGANAGGSIKDHMVRGELEELMACGRLRPGSTVSEISAGSTARSLAYHCRRLGLKCVLFVPDSVPSELIQNLEQLGASVEAVSMSEAYARYDAFTGGRPDVFRFDQLFDHSKRRHYRRLGEWIVGQAGRMDTAIGGVGTGHSLLGIAEGAKIAYTVTAEPAPKFKVPGVRNLEFDRYGEHDACHAGDFSQRIIVTSAEMFPGAEISTSSGLVAITPSFRLVLGALKVHLRGRGPCCVLAVGASNICKKAGSLARAG